MQGELQTVTSTARRAALESLYKATYSALRDGVYLAQPSSLTLENVETLLGAVARLLERYDGADNVDAFAQWAIETIVQPGAALLVALNTLKGEHTEAVRRGIRSVLATCGDLGVVPPGSTPGKGVGTIGELEAQTWTKIFLSLDKWLTPSFAKTPGRSPASLSTRLHAYARDQALGWRTDRLRHREKFGTLNDALASEQTGATGNRKPSLNELEQRAA
jgi:hypothetical protein